ncbi:APC family permease [Actinomadura sp. 3N407]|uniref:APC family permease n=1 Tax=Actinomadura sp. 3N407 TaxID=3457423 RepID=UPI003FCCB930
MIPVSAEHLRSPGRSSGASANTLSRSEPGTRTFPAASALPRTVSWRYAVAVGLGAASLIVVSFGPMRNDIGNLALVVWPVAAVVGALQCLLIGELASRFPYRAGGVAQFGYRAAPNGSHTLGAVSSWGYWFAWTPGIATHLILVSTYLHEHLLPGVNILLLAACIGTCLYAVNSLGLRITMTLNVGLAVFSIVPLTLLMIGPLFRPSSFEFGRVWPIEVPDEAAHDPMQLGLIFLKWLFVAAWAAYGAEMASTVVAEIRDATKRIPRSLGISGIICVITFTGVPISLIGTAGPPGTASEGPAAFTPAAEALFGSAGPAVIGLMLICAITLGAQVFILGSSRTIYQMSMDGHLPRVFATTNKRGAPVGSLFFDILIIVALLAIFGTDVVDIVAAAAVGYVVVFVLLPLAYLLLRRSPDGRPGAFRLPGQAAVLAVALFILNLLVLVVGGSLWGAKVMGIGLAITFAIVPISALTRRRARRRAESAAVPRTSEAS